MVEPRGAHDDLGVTVAVHVAPRRDGAAETRVRLVTLGGPGGGGCEAGGGAQVDEDPSLVGLAVVVERGAHHDVRKAVGVDVPRRRDRPTEERAHLIDLGGPGRRRREGIHGHGVDRFPVVEDQPYDASLGFREPFHPRRKLAAMRVLGPESCVPQHDAAATPPEVNSPAVGEEGRIERPGQGEIDVDLAPPCPRVVRTGGRRSGDREPMLEAARVVDVPLDDPAPVVVQPVPSGKQTDAPLGRFPPRAAVAEQGQAPLPRRLVLGARHDADAGLREVDPQVVGAIRRVPRAAQVVERGLRLPGDLVLARHEPRSGFGLPSGGRGTGGGEARRRPEC